MRKYRFLMITLVFAGALAGLFLPLGCTKAEGEAAQPLRLRITMDGFDGEDVMTRTSDDGLSWEAGDKFRMKIICPHTNDHQNGESWGSSFYTITLNGSQTYVSSSITTMAQATTYVFSAQNTTGNRIFVVDKYRYNRPSNFFHADQSKLDNFKGSDVVWAQAVRQTGAQEVHLNFKHKVAKLDIWIDDAALVDESGQPVPFSQGAVLTLEGMPDIDGAEIVVGDYYADQGYEDQNYCYRQKASCSYENNGKVLGIEVIEEDMRRSSIAPFSGGPAELGGQYSRLLSPVANDAVYTAYCAGRVDGRLHYMMYVPPCVLEQKAVFWLREGQRRFSAPLETLSFEQGRAYPVVLKFGTGSGEGSGAVGNE